jgi:hypothetical protein
LSFTGNATCNVFKTALLVGGVDFATDVFKIALYTNNATLNAQTLAYTTDGEAAGFGYTAGGQVITPTLGTLNGVAYVSFADVSWSGVITARGALIYKVGSGNPAVCVLDFGADRTSNTVFTVGFPPATSDSALIRIS